MASSPQEEIICKNCGSINDYRIEFKSNQRCAYCNSCESFIKNISYQPAKFYIGKYKQTLVKDCSDLPYMEWFIANTKTSPAMKKALDDRITELKKPTQNG